MRIERTHFRQRWQKNCDNDIGPHLNQSTNTMEKIPYDSIPIPGCQIFSKPTFLRTLWNRLDWIFSIDQISKRNKTSIEMRFLIASAKYVTPRFVGWVKIHWMPVIYFPKIPADCGVKYAVSRAVFFLLCFHSLWLYNCVAHSSICDKNNCRK